MIGPATAEPARLPGTPMIQFTHGMYTCIRNCMFDLPASFAILLLRMCIKLDLMNHKLQKQEGLLSQAR